MIFDVATTNLSAVTVRSAGGRAGTDCYRPELIRHDGTTAEQEGGVNTDWWAGYLSDTFNVTKLSPTPRSDDVTCQFAEHASRAMRILRN